MKPPPVAYRRASSSTEGIALLTEFGDESKVLAGGQSLIPLLSFRLSRPSVLVDINGASDLDYIRQEDSSLVIGALTRQRTVERHSLVREAVPLIPRALAHVGHVTNRNRGTFGGSLAHADPAAELPTVAVALDAEIMVQGPTGTRSVPAADFFLGPLTTVLDYNEMVVAVRIGQLPQGSGVGVEELARRKGDFAIAAAMAVVHLGPDGRADFARIAVSGVDSVPVRLTEAEEILLGSSIDDSTLAVAAASATAAVNPMEDVHASESYRRDMVPVLVSRAIRSALNEAKEGAR